MIELAGLGEVAGTRAAGLSLGMGQRLGQLLVASGVTVINDGTDLMRVSGTTTEQIGTAARRAHLPVYELTPTHASLEEAFMQVTKDSIEAAGAALDLVVRADRGRADRRPGGRDRGVRDAVPCLGANSAAGGVTLSLSASCSPSCVAVRGQARST